MKQNSDALIAKCRAHFSRFGCDLDVPLDVAVNALLMKRNELVSDCHYLRKELEDCKKKHDAQIKKLQANMESQGRIKICLYIIVSLLFAGGFYALLS